MRMPLVVALALASLQGVTLDARAEPLGRLFFTPERRAALERQRQLNIQEIQALEGSSLSLDGIVVRSSGKRTVWINRRPQNENDQGAPVVAEVLPGAPSQASVTTGEEGTAHLKVGQSIHRVTRETEDGLGGGRIVVHRPADAKAARPR